MRLNFIPKIAKDLTRKGCQNSWQIFEVWIILGSFGHCMTRKGNSPLHHVIIGNLKRWLFFAAKFIWTNKECYMLLYAILRAKFPLQQFNNEWIMFYLIHATADSRIILSWIIARARKPRIIAELIHFLLWNAVFSTEKLLLLTIQTY